MEPEELAGALKRLLEWAQEHESDGPLRVTEHHLVAALTELREGGETLTNTLLGARPTPIEPPDPE